jgi:hypothetical protein
MPDASHSEDEPFVVEPVEQLDGLPAPPARRLRLAHQVQHHRLLGLVTLAEGLALLGLFWSAPWFYWRILFIIEPHITSPEGYRQLTLILAPHLSPGWEVAQGVSIPSESESAFSFGSLWLTFFIGVALVALGILHLRRLLSSRLTLMAILILSLLALLIEAGLYLQVQHFQEALGDFIGVGVSWGFWGAAGVNAGAIAAGVGLFRFARPGVQTRGAEGRGLTAPAEP